MVIDFGNCENAFMDTLPLLLDYELTVTTSDHVTRRMRLTAVLDDGETIVGTKVGGPTEGQEIKITVDDIAMVSI